MCERGAQCLARTLSKRGRGALSNARKFEIATVGRVSHKSLLMGQKLTLCWKLSRLSIVICCVKNIHLVSLWFMSQLFARESARSGDTSRNIWKGAFVLWTQ